VEGLDRPVAIPLMEELGLAHFQPYWTPSTDNQIYRNFLEPPIIIILGLFPSFYVPGPACSEVLEIPNTIPYKKKKGRLSQSNAYSHK
jgi:hypothetical protein